MCSRVTQIKEDLGMMDSIQSMAFQTRVWNKTEKWVLAILLQVEHVWSSIPNQHMCQPLLWRSGCQPRWPSPESDSTLLIGVKRSSTIVGSQALEALMLHSTISSRLEWKIEGVIGCANSKKQKSQSIALGKGEGVEDVGCERTIEISLILLLGQPLNYLLKA